MSHHCQTFQILPDNHNKKDVILSLTKTNENKLLKKGKYLTTLLPHYFLSIKNNDANHFFLFLKEISVICELCPNDTSFKYFVQTLGLGTP